MEADGMGWDRMGPDGMRWDGMGWDGMGWVGLGRGEVRRGGMGSYGVACAETITLRARKTVGVVASCNKSHRTTPGSPSALYPRSVHACLNDATPSAETFMNMCCASSSKKPTCVGVAMWRMGRDGFQAVK